MQYNLKVRKVKRRVKTTDSTHDLPLYPDIVKDLLPNRPCQLIVSDITYIPYYLDPESGEYKFCYLALITDYYTKEIVGYSVAPTLEAIYAIEALKMALDHYKGNDLSQLIHHSDRGVQYASYQYTDLLKKYGIKISMTETGNPKDNAVAERVNNTIKNELLKGMSFTSMLEVSEAVKAAIRFYNEERPHLSLDGLTPREAAKKRGEFDKKWISYREKAIKAKVA
ncbi:IS3 family transposase [Prevotella sp.]|uniref:IS3 family transposase n=1 Tax=Prevotella sp. TaxID=59823 RepID=UPI00307BF900